MDKFNFKKYLFAEEVISEIFDIPTVKKVGKIVQLDYRKNPILIMLNDNTKLYLTYDEFKRIKPKIKLGDTISVIMQRSKNDKSNIPSKITSIKLV